MNSQVLLKVLGIIQSKPLIISDEFVKSVQVITNKYFKIQVPGGEMYLTITDSDIDIIDGLTYLSADSFFVMKSRLARSTRGKLIVIDMPVVMITELTKSEYDDAFHKALQYQSLGSKEITKVEYFRLMQSLDTSKSHPSSSDIERVLTQLAGKCFRFTYMESDELWLSYNDKPDYTIQDSHILVKCSCIYSDSADHGSYSPDIYYDVRELSDTCVYEEVSNSDFRKKVNKLIK